MEQGLKDYLNLQMQIQEQIELVQQLLLLKDFEPQIDKPYEEC
jgi:hypothetical protein